MDIFHTEMNGPMHIYAHTHVFLGQTVHNSNGKEDIAITRDFTLVYLNLFDFKICKYLQYLILLTEYSHGGERINCDNLTRFQPPYLSLFQKSHSIAEITPLTKLWPRSPKFLSLPTKGDQNA